MKRVVLAFTCVLAVPAQTGLRTELTPQEKLAWVALTGEMEDAQKKVDAINVRGQQMLEKLKQEHNAQACSGLDRGLRWANCSAANLPNKGVKQ